MNAYLFVPDVNDFGLAPAIACGVHVKDLERRTENEREDQSETRHGEFLKSVFYY